MLNREGNRKVRGVSWGDRAGDALDFRFDGRGVRLGARRALLSDVI